MNQIELVFGFLIPTLAAGTVGWLLRDRLFDKLRESNETHWQGRLEMAEHATQHAEEIARGLRAERLELRRRLTSAERELASRTRRLEEVNRSASEAASRARYLRKATLESNGNGSNGRRVDDARLADAEQEVERSRELLASAQRELADATAYNQLLQSQIRSLRQTARSDDPTQETAREPTSAQVIEITSSHQTILEALQGDLASAHNALCENDAQLVEATSKIAELESQLRAARGAIDDSNTARILEQKDRRIAELSEDLQRLLRAHQRGPGDSDDLERIRGIGPKIAAELEELGIRTYRQIARWSALDVEKICQQLPVSASRIHRDDWINSAKRQLRRKYQQR